MLHERARQVDPLLVLPSSFAHGHGGCDGGDEVGEEVCPYHHDGDREPKLLCQLWSNAAGRSDHLDDGVVEAADVEGSYVVLGLARGWIRFGGRTSSVRNRSRRRVVVGWCARIKRDGVDAARLPSQPAPPTTASRTCRSAQ